MAKKVTTAVFDIVDPPSNSFLGASFGVYGNCSDLAAFPGLTITVNLTLTKLADGTVITLPPQTATTDPTARTWEAFFDNVPASIVESGKLIAESSVGGAQTAPSEKLSIASAVQAGLELDFPNNGESVTGPLGPVPLPVGSATAAALGAKKAKGKHPEFAFAVAFVTNRGKRQKNTTTTLNPVSTADGKSKWELNLDDLFDAQVASGRFGLHFRITEAGKTHRVSRGSFKVV